MPAGTDLPLYSAALDILSNAYFRTHKEAAVTGQLSRDGFIKLIEPELQEIEKKINGNTRAKAIMNNIKNAVNIGSADRMRIFLNNIKIRLSESENDALRARHQMAHDIFDTSDHFARIRSIRLRNTYRTLINRIILRLAGYDGTYIDYGTDGHPQKPISETGQ